MLEEFGNTYLLRQLQLTLSRAFVTSKVDYCNLISYGLPNYELQRLRQVLNAAVRLLTSTRKYDHISRVLVMANLHWLLN